MRCEVFIVMLNVIMLSAVLIGNRFFIVMLNVIMLSVDLISIMFLLLS